jgi:hypothetical protein
MTRGSHEYFGFYPKVFVRPPGLHLRRLRPRATDGTQGRRKCAPILSVIVFRVAASS